MKIGFDVAVVRVRPVNQLNFMRVYMPSRTENSSGSVEFNLTSKERASLRVSNFQPFKQMMS